MMARIEAFGAYRFPAHGWEEEEQLNQGRSPLTELPLADGAWDHLGDDSPKKLAGQVSCRFILQSPTFEGLDDLADGLLAAMRQGRQKLYWRYRSGKTRWAWAKCVSIAMPKDRQSRLVLPVTVTFQVAESYRYAKFPAGPRFYGDSGLYGEGLLYGEGSTVSFPFSGTTNITVRNDGNAPALATVTISCAAGQSAQNVKVERHVDGMVRQWFQAMRTIAATKSLVVDCAAYSVRYDGEDDYGNFRIGDNQVEWLHLMPGDNNIRICANAGDAGTISFLFYPTYH